MSDATSPQADGAASARRHRRRWWLIGGLAAVGLVVLAGVATVGALLAHGERNIERIEVEGIESSGDGGGDEDGGDDADVEELNEILHVLVVGSDRRDGLSGEDRERLGTGEVDGNRTDTIMLMRLDPSTEEVAVLSFPRDLLVTRCDGSRGKINAAYHVGERSDIGGASCLVQTVTGMSGLPIHHFVEVDFAGFLDVVDLVDGVTVYLEEPIRDPLAHLDLDAGCHRLSGVEALGFVRHRASDSDYGRIARQQRFMKELVREASSLSNVLNVPRLFRMVETGASAVTTDQSLTTDKMRRIAFTLRDLDSDALEARTIPGDYQRIEGIDFEIPREREAERLFRAFEQGRLGAEPESIDGDGGPEGQGAGDDEGDPGAGTGDGAGAEGGADDGAGAEGGADDGGGAVDAGSDESGQTSKDPTDPDDAGQGSGDAPGSQGLQDEGVDPEAGPNGHATPPPGSEKTFVGAQPPPERCR